jgi:hypothetical protein
MLWWKKGVLSCAVMHASCCQRSTECSGGRRVCYPALPCMLAAVVITECSGAEEGCAIPALPCMQAAVMMFKELWWEGLLSSAAMQARCCCDLTECSGGRKVVLRCACMQLAAVIHRMLWWWEGCAILRCACIMQSCFVMIHRMLWWVEEVCIPALQC